VARDVAIEEWAEAAHAKRRIGTGGELLCYGIGGMTKASKGKGGVRRDSGKMGHRHGG